MEDSKLFVFDCFPEEDRICLELQPSENENETEDFCPPCEQYETLPVEEDNCDCEEENVECDDENFVSAIWNIVKQWLTDDQKCKVNFITAKNLPTFIHKKHLLKSLGGEVSQMILNFKAV